MKIKNIKIILAEENFKREAVISKEHEMKLDVRLSIPPKDQIKMNQNRVVVRIVLKMRGINKITKEEEFSIDTLFYGSYEIIDYNDNLTEEEMGGKGAELSFPYIREHILSLSHRAGLSPIIIESLYVDDDGKLVFNRKENE